MEMPSSELLNALTALWNSSCWLIVPLLLQALAVDKNIYHRSNNANDGTHQAYDGNRRRNILHKGILGHHNGRLWHNRSIPVGSLSVTIIYLD